ncbi:MAG: glycosyltransferase family 39 protein [Ruminococcus sp.]|nr:glycosyltransferase family 39 protein [Ruminococcus sp.]
MSKENLTESVVKAFSAHPYLWALGICLALDPFFLGSLNNIPNNALYMETFLVICAIAAGAAYLYRTREIKKVYVGLIAGLLIFSTIVGAKLYSGAENKAVWHLAGGYAIVIWLYWQAKSKELSDQINSLFIMGLGFCLKLYYIIGTSTYTRQNDVHVFGGESGHAGYMEYLLYNRHLPDFDVRERWQFCHPPLHHTISAIWIYINENIFKVGYDPARESIQTLTLFYAMCIMISAYKILRHFGLSGKALYIPLVVINFHPAFILFSGAINNDVLSVALSMGAVVCTLNWYREQKMSTILKIALCVGLAMMTKVAAATVAPPIAIVFLTVFIAKLKKQWKQLILQFLCFGIVCVPLGLWFGIRNYIKWKVPLTYVQEMSKDSYQYIGDMSFISRITDFSPKLFANPYEQWGDADEFGVVKSYNEYNPLVALLKNSLFGENIYEDTFGKDTYLNAVCAVFFWLALIIAAFAFVMIGFMCIKKTEAKLMEKLFLIAYYLMLMFTFYHSSAKYPFTCTMNFRYITPTVIIGAASVGMFVSRIQDNRDQASGTAVKVINCTCLLFAVLSTFIYLNVCVNH